jgi:hypothetical protein
VDGERCRIEGEKEMTERVIPDKVLSFVKDLKEDRKTSADWHYTRADATSDNQQRKIETINGNMMRNFEIIYSMINYTMESVNIVDLLIEELSKNAANKEQLQTLREELTSKVNQTLKPIKDEIERESERKKRSSDIGIQ